MRETRSYGSARGVRSNPYPYRDTPINPMRSMAGFSPHLQHGTFGKQNNPEPHLRDHHHITPPWQDRHTASSGFGLGFDPGIRTRIRRLNGPRSGRGSETGSPQESAKGNTSGSAAKEKILRTDCQRI